MANPGYHEIRKTCLLDAYYEFNDGFIEQYDAGDRSYFCYWLAGATDRVLPTTIMIKYHNLPTSFKNINYDS